MLPENGEMPPEEGQEGTQPGDGQEQQPPAGDPHGAGDAGAPPTPPAGDLQAVQAELERTRTALQAANQEAAKRRKKIEQYEKAEAERKQAEMTELEKLQAAKEAAEQRAADAEEQANRRLIEAAFVSEASKQGAKFPEDAYALADRSGVVIGEDGKVAGVAEAVKTLVAGGRLPLSTPPAPGLDGGSGSGQPQTRVTLTTEEEEVARKMGMKPEEYAQYKRSPGQEDRRL